LTSAARRVLDVTARSIAASSEELGPGFEAAVDAIVNIRGRLICSGLGKSGIVCRKLAATFSSTGTPAYFVHSADALHGDLGMIHANDTVLGISHSGGTEELVSLLERTKRHGARLIAMTGNADSAIARGADIVISYRVEEEGGPLNLAPMASTSVAMAIGDALAAEVMARRGFTEADFTRIHPGGGLGKQLVTIADILRAHRNRMIPTVSMDATLLVCLEAMSASRLGVTTVVDGDATGILSDGDVRRCLESRRADAFSATAGELCTWNPRGIESHEAASKALGIMESSRITALLVRDTAGAIVGVVHLHDLWGLQMI
jgi:arabinose-5-phosphate isomerase